VSRKNVIWVSLKKIAGRAFSLPKTSAERPRRCGLGLDPVTAISFPPPTIAPFPPRNKKEAKRMVRPETSYVLDEEVVTDAHQTAVGVFRGAAIKRQGHLR
jgi:hypothetical protein